MRELIVTAAFDPSLGVGQNADYKALITVGLDWRSMVIYVLDAWIRRDSLDQAIAAAYNRHGQFGWRLFGVETNMFQKLLIREFRRAEQERKQFLPLKEIENRLAKETRISGLSPLVERGLLRFRRGQSDQDLLVEQLLYFPSKSVHDDGPDALEMAVRLLNEVSLPGQAAYEGLGKRRFGAERAAY
jgi:predicted phage terminase large subunit-like protein